MVHLVFKGPVHRTGKRPATQHNWTRKDWTSGCGCINPSVFRLPVATFMPKGTGKRPVATSGNWSFLAMDKISLQAHVTTQSLTKCVCLNGSCLVPHFEWQELSLVDKYLLPLMPHLACLISCQALLPCQLCGLSFDSPQSIRNCYHPPMQVPKQEGSPRRNATPGALTHDSLVKWLLLGYCSPRPSPHTSYLTLENCCWF
jgi:hypothetical protein